ncbi:MAG: helix-hairpin-helix domain-containing protein [Gemmatimonadota bacterium]|nr:helix-hairpin-helix domain-containing protein [Gemmatimonadota bacterium]
MLHLNRTDRKSLATATAIVLAGTALRLGLGPTPSPGGWVPAGNASAGPASPAGLRDSVEAALQEEERASRPLAAGERLDPNFADAVELRRLPGLGPAKAEAIVRDRRARGPFRFLEDLERVPGLGTTTVTRLAPHLALTRRPPGVDSTPGPVDLNRASADDLAGLPGVGPAIARRIVAHRARRPFRSVDELLDVAGIGPVTLEKLRTRVQVR